MTQHLHRDLQNLSEEYDKLVASVEAQQVSIGDAREVLEALGVIDADGHKWGMDEQGNFTRQIGPDGIPEPTNPSLYTSRQATTTTPPKPPWDTSTNPTTSPFTNHRAYTPKRSSPVITKIVEITKTNIVTVVVLVIGVLVVGYTLTDKSSNNPETNTPTESTLVTPPTTTTAPETQEPNTTNPTEETTTTTLQAQVPSAERIAAVLNVLEDGNRDDTAAVMMVSGGVSRIVTELVFYQGLEPAKLEIQTDPPENIGDGTALQHWRVVDSNTNETHLTLTATWVRDGNTWRLITWPI
ncbi:MAG: hypothetical protein WC184_12310 [Acidimicrobiia bacterium]